MSSKDVLDRYRNVEERSYGEWIARKACPLCQGDTLIREDGDGQTDIHCRNSCPPLQILAALGLSPRVLWPTRGKVYHAPDPDWWTKPRRYGAGPLPPMEEQ
ncbi:hypothetical protein D769_04359 [Cupriavidus sp. HMR-1]|uniref:hypothetical protein n=1 Tax=Cupriavidus sp. HMR-1 TaxID=1249621 RepID=UPI0002A2C223|nr:hypothetical protein [Cupriavidus sp. HMR-1]ELA00632.1 hypothetical protein D769_04359 [Cupriavidus sp. HMR-1]